MAEIYGKRTGYNKGKSGTLHIAAPEVNALCTTTVVGGGPGYTGSLQPSPGTVLHPQRGPAY
jgi:hypothetical protein